MVSSIEPKPELLEGIQKTHDLWIPRGLHIFHNKYPIVFLLPVNSSSLLYIMLLIAIENVLTLVGNVFSSSEPS